MAPLHLNELPIEVLQRVCSYLGVETRQSLYAFALASRRCHSATKPQMFWKIHLTVLGRKKLQLDIDRWLSRLESTCSFKHVRQLEVEGRMPREQTDMGLVEHIFLGRLYDSNDDFALPPLDDAYHTDTEPASAAHTEDDAWQPLAKLIRHLPVLADLVYACPSQFSPCLLETLHHLRPRCRLTIKTFRFRSQLSAVSSVSDESDPYEFALATSPCLHSILARYSGYDSGGNEDFNEEAVMRAVKLAPRLKEAQMWRIRAGSSPALLELWHNPRPRRAWRGFSLDQKGEKVDQLASLRKLELGGYNLITQQMLEAWSTHTDFSKLEVLKLLNDVQSSAINWAAYKCDFRSLNTLILGLPSPKDQESGDLCSTVNSFLRTLPPLTSLKLTGDFGRSNFASILEHHGEALKRLWLSPDEKLGADRLVFTASEIDDLRKHCPLLEDLNLPMPRSKGDLREVAVYTALGAVPRLRTLSLTLDSSNPDVFLADEDAEDSGSDDSCRDDEIPKDHSFDVFNQQVFRPADPEMLRAGDCYPRHGHICNAFINSAMDEPLAQAIFQRISADQSCSSHTLERLELHSSGGQFFGNGISMPGPARDVIQHIGRSWLLERNQRDDRRHEISAKELNRENRKHFGIPEMIHDEAIGLIFRRIWPRTSNGPDDWQNDWHGLPLSS